MKANEFEQIVDRLEALYILLIPKMPFAEAGKEYIQVGEYCLALEMLADWCLDANPTIELNGNEFRAFFELGEALGCRHSWVDLLPIVEPAALHCLSSGAIALAQQYVRAERSANPQRTLWLEKVSRVLELSSSEDRISH